MTYTSIPVEQFGGLNLADDPREVAWNGAIDISNVEFDRRGRLRSRDGYSAFGAAGSFDEVHWFRYAAATPASQLVCSTIGGALDVRDNSGAAIAAGSAPVPSNGGHTFVNYGTESGTYCFAANGSDNLRRWDGAAWTTPAYTGFTTPNGYYVTSFGAEAAGNRLVNARFYGTAKGSNYNSVRFSNAGDPTTWGTNDYVDFSPGDGESINAIVAWRDLLFVFKDTKFFVVYGTSTNASGSPIFNYRPILKKQGVPQDVTKLVAAQQRFSGRRAIATPYGVFFINENGVWLTTGSEPAKVSAALDPIFEGIATTYFSSVLDETRIAYAALGWHRGRLYVSYALSASGENERTLVYDPVAEKWTLWSFGIRAMTQFTFTNGTKRLMFQKSPGTSNPLSTYDVGYFSPTTTTDNGTAITTRYRLGFRQITGRRPDGKSVIRQCRLKGSGSVTFGVAADGATSIPSSGGGAQASVTLADAPGPNYRVAQMGNTFSPQISSSSGVWRLDELEADAR